MKVLRLGAVCQKIGLSKASIYKQISQGEFPLSVQLGERAVGWLESDIDDWIAKRVKASKGDLGE